MALQSTGGQLPRLLIHIVAPSVGVPDFTQKITAVSGFLNHIIRCRVRV
jgi:hypothetical protein